MTRITLALLFLASTAATAAAQPNPEPAADTTEAPAAPIALEADEAALAFAVAKVCANEASLSRPTVEDCALIWQTVRRHGETAQERLSWLSRHSGCVLGEEAPEDRSDARSPPTGSNCWWSWHLTEAGDEPANFDARARWDRYQATWLRMLHSCRRLVRGDRPPRGWPCPHDPDTWGGLHVDMDRALRHGMHPLSCRGTVNEGFRWRGNPPPRRRSVR